MTETKRPADVYIRKGEALWITSYPKRLTFFLTRMRAILFRSNAKAIGRVPAIRLKQTVKTPSQPYSFRLTIPEPRQKARNVGERILGQDMQRSVQRLGTVGRKICAWKLKKNVIF